MTPTRPTAVDTSAKPLVEGRPVLGQAPGAEASMQPPPLPSGSSPRPLGRQTRRRSPSSRMGQAHPRRVNQLKASGDLSDVVLPPAPARTTGDLGHVPLMGPEGQRKPAPGATDGDDRSWRGRAACRGSGELFFAPSSDDGPARGWSAEQAKAVCGSCPVLAECRAWAVLTRQQDGVWGGLDEDELRRLQRRRRDPAARAS